MSCPSFAMERPVCVLGLDCADPDALLVQLKRKREKFMEADEILAGPRFIKFLEQDIDLAPRLVPLAFPVSKIAKKLKDNIAQGRRSLVLADGDPLFFGIGGSLLQYLDPGLIEFIPAVSCLQAICARLGQPWHNLAALSLHGREDCTQLLAAARMGRTICLLLGNGPGPDAVARLLLDRGITAYTAQIFSAMDNEGTGGFHSLEECARRAFSNCQTMLLSPFARGSRRVDLAGKYHTNEVVAAAILKALELEMGDVVWDVGSGSGSVALEMSRFAPAALIYAIERMPNRILDIQLNRKRLGAANLNVIYGEAPQILENLQTPNKIFIGGGLSGEKGRLLLEYCAERLPPGGRLAMSCILLESLNLCRQFVAKMQWAVKIWQVQVSEAEGLGKGERLKAHNPVFVAVIEKPDFSGK